ncbi:MAG: murein biosynthesis integral membrane protein MurJ [Myxococcota bacterium]
MSSLARNAGIVSFYTMLSRITGLARDTIFLHIFGANHMADAFLMAFTIPNAFRNLVAEGALTVAFLPVFKQSEREGGDEAVRRLMGQALAVFPLLAIGVSLLCILGATPIVNLFAPGFKLVPGKFELTVLLVRWMFMYLALVSFVALTMGALNARGYFASSSASQLIFNCVHICFIVTAARLVDPPMLGVAFGVLTGGVAQVIVQIVALKQAKLWVRPRLVFGPEIRRILKIMGPAVASLAIYQLNIAALRYFTSYLGEGAVTYLYSADRFFQLPLGVFAVAIATASLPALTEALNSGGKEKLAATFRQSVQLNNFITIPSAVGLAVLALPITATISQHGQFTHQMSIDTAYALIWLSAGLVAVANIRVTSQVFFALQDTRTPVVCGAVGFLANLGLAPYFALNYGFVGLPMSISASAWLQLAVALWFLSRRAGRLGMGSIIGRALRDTLAAAFMGAVAWQVAVHGSWGQGFTIWNVVVLTGSCTAGGLAYALCQTAFRAPELNALRNRLFRRRRRA